MPTVLEFPPPPVRPTVRASSYYITPHVPNGSVAGWCWGCWECDGSGLAITPIELGYQLTDHGRTCKGQP
jgi:hypothetical protein